MGKSDNILIHCENITKSFFIRKREIPILRRINFTANKGEIIVISGKSGTGKSTFLNILGGLEHQTYGSVTFENQRLEAFSSDELARFRRQKLGIIFQSFNLLPSWTALENVESAMTHTGLKKSDRIERAKNLLLEFGLDDRFYNLPSELSVGQQQRVAIARAFANNPSLILADEPTGDVDAETAQIIIESLILPVKEKSVTLIIATHGAFPFDTADRVLLMENGMLVDR